MASIGLVGNGINLLISNWVGNAYRLASIGLVGNLQLPNPIYSPRYINRLPIGFDRIGWKLLDFERPPLAAKLAYRLASIGLVGNSYWRLPTTRSRLTGLPIGFDRISWKLKQA